MEFYTRLFSSSNAHDLDRVLEVVKWVVTESMNADLMKPYTREEVDATIKQMAPLKVVGPDGMPSLFYQAFWQNVGLDVSKAVCSCLNTSTLLKSINHTFITLIPEVCNPENILEFIPISLCNVFL